MHDLTDNQSQVISSSILFQREKFNDLPQRETCKDKRNKNINIIFPTIEKTERLLENRSQAL